jgi:hypothetical protein
MKEYAIQYTKQGIAYLLFFLSFVIMTLSIAVLHIFFKDFTVLVIILSIVFAVAFFLINKHYIKRTGKAELLENEVILYLSESTQISFSKLKYYYIYNGKNGIVFTLGFLDGGKLKIGANNNFCDIEPLKNFLADLRSAIEKYKVQNEVNIIHLESILARKNAVYVLILVTMLVILGFILTKMPVMIISIGFTLPIIFNWINYFQLKQANKLVDF